MLGKNPANNKELFRKRTLFRPVSASSLGLFRMLFGLIMVWQIFCGFNVSFVKSNFIDANYHFPFSFFEFLHLPYLPPMAINILILVMGGAAIMIFAGFFFRPASIILFLGFLYIVLSEKSIYHDYYYLVLLATFLLIFTNADRWPALSTFRRKGIPNPQIPFWQIFILRAQFAIVYFYAALSKVNPDWLLHAQPLKALLDTKSVLGISLEADWIAFGFSWTGFLIDILVAILLILGRGRYIAFACALFFNLVNLWLFHDIEAFPILMISGLVLFLDPATPSRLMERNIPSLVRPVPQEVPQKEARHKNAIITGIIIYMFIQVLVPLRYLLYPGHPAWTFEGTRCAWRLKLNAKKVDLKVLVTDPATGRTWEVPYQHRLTNQQTWIDNIPDMLLQYVHALKDDLKKAGYIDPIIRVEAFAKYNDRPRQPYIDGRVNLADVEYPLFSHAKWIVPLRD